MQSPCEGTGVGNVRFLQWGVRSASSTRYLRKVLEGWGRGSRKQSARGARRCHQRALCNREWQQEDFREPYALGGAKGTNKRRTGWSYMCGGRCAPYPCGTPCKRMPRGGKGMVQFLVPKGLSCMNSGSLAKPPCKVGLVLPSFLSLF